MTDHDAPTAPATELLTLAEAAAVLRTPVATLRHWRHLGVGPDGFRLGRRVMYRRQNVDGWLTERRQAQSPAGDPASGKPSRADDRLESLVPSAAEG